jgi:hypothetical protein
VVAERAVAVVLSGVLDDGAVGAALIDRAGGHVLVQDPDEAEFAGMPRAALAAAPGARAVPVRQLAWRIRHSLDAVQSRGSRAAASGAKWGTDMDMVESADPAFLLEDESKLTRLSCPDCGGAMAQVDLPQISYFRCHIGHQFAPQALAAAQVEASEKSCGSSGLTAQPGPLDLISQLDPGHVFHQNQCAGRQVGASLQCRHCDTEVDGPAAPVDCAYVTTNNCRLLSRDHSAQPGM